jgi:hypothetical protein
MKKTIIALMLVLVLLAACDSTGKQTSNDTAKSGVETELDKDETPKTQNENTDKIDLANTILVDDETVTIKAVSFFKKEWADHTDACVCFEVTNNLNREILFQIYADSLYLGGNQVNTSGLDGNSGPLPGKTGQYSYIISKENGGETVPIESLEELYDLNGKINISVYAEDKSSIESDLGKEYIIDLSTLK